MAAPIGRPRLYSDPLELAAQCEAYFAHCEETGEKLMISGLAYFLGFADKTTLYDYRDREDFSHPIKRAILRIEMNYEGGLTEQSVAGRIFALKNMGWKDKNETELSNPDGTLKNETKLIILRGDNTQAE